MSFANDLARFAAKTQARADLIVSKILLDIGRSVTLKSPVGDASYWASPPPKGYVGGRFRGNWQLGVGSAPGGTLDVIDPGGGATIGAIAAEIPAQSAGHVYYIANNLPYAQALEEGWSRQAPQGMVGLTVQEFSSYVRVAATSL